MILYSTVLKEGSAEQTIEKSRFITYVSPASSKEEADAFIASIKKKHKDATHNVPAMVIGEKMQIQWASDDGEPQGTSGAPIVQMLVNMGITNVVVVVTRYFGGIKLGTGGLVRAYTSSAKLGLEEAGIGDVEEYCILEYETDYTYLTQLQNISKNNYFILDTVYADKVILTLSFKPDRIDDIQSLLDNTTRGSGKVKKISKKMLTKARE